MQQVLGTPSRRGQAHGQQLTHQGTRVYPHRREPTTTCWVPISTDPTQGPRSLPSCTDGGTEAPPPEGQQLPSNSGQRWHEADTRSRRTGISAPFHGPGALGESLTPKRTSQQGCYATNRMWPASRSIAPGLERREGVAKGEAGDSVRSCDPGWSWLLWASVSPSVQWPWWGEVTVTAPESQSILTTPTPHTDNSVLGRPNTTLRPLPLPTVLTGTRCSNLVVLGWGWQDPAGWQASPGFGPGTYNQLLPL